jgi:hypothetical protein
MQNNMPGRDKQCKAFHYGKQNYQQIRNEVQQQACDLIAGFRLDMQETLDGRFSRDFTNRWQTVTGRKWDGSA